MVYRLAREMGQWDVRAFVRSLTWEQLSEWGAYYEMSDFVQNEMQRGNTPAVALQKFAAIQEIQAEARLARG